MRSLTLTSALVVVLLLVAGCGGSGESSHEEKVHQVAKEIRSIDRQERTFVELRVLEDETEARDGADEAESVEFLEESWQHQISRLVRSATSAQIAHACEEVSESAFCKEQKK